MTAAVVTRLLAFVNVFTTTGPTSETLLAITLARESSTRRINATLGMLTRCRLALVYIVAEHAAAAITVVTPTLVIALGVVTTGFSVAETVRDVFGAFIDVDTLVSRRPADSVATPAFTLVRPDTVDTIVRTDAGILTLVNVCTIPSVAFEPGVAFARSVSNTSGVYVTMVTCV